jgi:TPR repeat protein
MADVAHDASGPALSEPAGIALQQASGPTSSDKGKLRVFISYSRDDLNFADQLDAALTLCGFECLIDRHGISGGEDWKRRLGNLISEADTVVFVLSPSSARSEICDWEVEEAARLNKRILPVKCRPLEDVSPPPRLQDLNYMFFYEEPKVPGSGFGTGLASLVAALNTDFDWLREHSRYLQRATEWDRGGRPANRLLSGDDISEAKAWVVRRPKNAPEPTALHLDFFRASEEEAEARSSAQRKQLEEMAAAQAEREKALHEAEEAQRKRATMARVRNIALVAVSIFALLAGWGYWSALEQRDAANSILANATLVFRRIQDRVDWETQKDFFWVFKMGAEHGDAMSMGILGRLYAEGFGVGKDYAKAREWLQKALEKGSEASRLTLEKLPMWEAADAGRYAKALQLQEALAAKVEAAEIKRDGKPGDETAQALNEVAWYAMLAREFAKALAVSDRAHALLPDELAIEFNRAHALMFLERGEDTKALYLAHKGKPVSEQDARLWENVIAEGFAEFRKVGLTHPMMADIEKELGISR